MDFFSFSYLSNAPFSTFSRIGWAGFTLASSNFIYDSVSVPKRGICVAYFNPKWNGFGIFFGGILGGLLAQPSQYRIYEHSSFHFPDFRNCEIYCRLYANPKIEEIRKC